MGFYSVLRQVLTLCCCPSSFRLRIMLHRGKQEDWVQPECSQRLPLTTPSSSGTAFPGFPYSPGESLMGTSQPEGANTSCLKPTASSHSHCGHTTPSAIGGKCLPASSQQLTWQVMLSAGVSKCPGPVSFSRTLSKFQVSCLLWHPFLVSPRKAYSLPFVQLFPCCEDASDKDSLLDQNVARLLWSVFSSRLQS